MEMNPHQLTYQFQDIQALKRAYMSFVHDGGIFIPTEETFHLGDFVMMTVTLPKNEQPFIFTGEVIWITPKSPQIARQPGIGVQCTDVQGETFHAAILELLGDASQEDNEEADTM